MARFLFGTVYNKKRKRKREIWRQMRSKEAASSAPCCCLRRYRPSLGRVEEGAKRRLEQRNQKTCWTKPSVHRLYMCVRAINDMMVIVTGGEFDSGIDLIIGT